MLEPTIVCSVCSTWCLYVTMSSKTIEEDLHNNNNNNNINKNASFLLECAPYRKTSFSCLFYFLYYFEVFYGNHNTWTRKNFCVTLLLTVHFPYLHFSYSSLTLSNFTLSLSVSHPLFHLVSYSYFYPLSICLCFSLSLSFLSFTLSHSIFLTLSF